MIGIAIDEGLKGLVITRFGEGDEQVDSLAAPLSQTAEGIDLSAVDDYIHPGV